MILDTVKSDSRSVYPMAIAHNMKGYDVKVNADALTSVFEKTGDAVFVTHSQGCGIGWLIGMQSDHVKGIVAYEPGSGFPFPKGEVPTPIENAGFSET